MTRGGGGQEGWLHLYREDVRGVAGVALAIPFFQDLFYMPSRLLAIWSSGHLVIRTSGHPVFWPSDHPAFWLSGYPDFWPSDHLVIWLSGHLIIRSSGHLVFCPEASKMFLLGYFWPTLSRSQKIMTSLSRYEVLVF